MHLPITSIALLALALGLAPAALASSAEVEAAFHQPETADASVPAPKPTVWKEPKPDPLPSAESLNTITISNQEFTITKAGAVIAPGAKEMPQDGSSLVFQGSGGGGRKSSERLVVENCTFVMDFQGGNLKNWDEKRCAIFVKGYKEVIVRGCKFISKASPGDPERKIMASVGIYDCLQVLVEDCYFEGKTNWMRGHVTVYCSGPTTIRRCEVSGAPGSNACGGGFWIATGLGEGKIGVMHGDDPSLLMYPIGPVLIEDCYLHDQKGNQNTDAIYIQSAHTYLVRNTHVENWRTSDGMFDIGARDTANGKRQWKGGFLTNHGGIGVIEHCRFVNGFLKVSVGIAGGLIFRNNYCENVYLMPYIFDGGSWYILGCEFKDLPGPFITCSDKGMGGWTPREGMLINGAKMVWGNNIIRMKAPPAVILANRPLNEVFLADYNIYDFTAPPQKWAVAKGGGAEDCATFADWQERTNNDRHSVLGRQTLDIFSRVDPATLQLPGGIPMKFGPVETGLTGKVGPRGASAAR